MGEGAKLIAQAFMKEKALIYSKSFTSPLWMWSDERNGAEGKGEERGVSWWGQGQHMQGVNKVHLQHIR